MTGYADHGFMFNGGDDDEPFWDIEDAISAAKLRARDTGASVGIIGSRDGKTWHVLATVSPIGLVDLTFEGSAVA